MTISSTSSPLAEKIPQSFAARRGKAVIVNPALEILSFNRRSWLSAEVDQVQINPRKINEAKNLRSIVPAPSRPKSPLPKNGSNPAEANPILEKGFKGV
jgi:hypothetical protein